MTNFPLTTSTSRARLLSFLVGVALVAGACSKAANTNNANSNATNTNSAATAPANTPSNSPSLSPTAAFKAYQEAMRKKDFEGAKKRMSKGSLAWITEQAKKDGKTLEQSFQEVSDREPNDEEVTNEKITGDTATVDLKNKDASLTMPMVKEDGEWKIAFDVFVKQMDEAFKEMGKEMDKNKSNPNAP